MTESRTKDLIKAWRTKARRESDQFSRFVFLWFCFNAWLAFESDKEKDREMLDWLEEADESRSQLRLSYNHALSSGTDIFRSRLESLVQSAPIPDSRGRRQDIHVEDVNDFSGIVEAIYRVRCNLFHGGKEANNPHDQKLVKACGDILEKWVGNLIATWRV